MALKPTDLPPVAPLHLINLFRDRGQRAKRRSPKMPKRELSLNSLCRTVSIIKKVKFEPHQQESDTESSNSAEESDKEK